MKIAIRNTQLGDILIEDEDIVKVGSFDTHVDVEVDATGLLVFPALVDIHVHFREPGEEYKENIGTGSLCAASGGFWAVCTMPNTNPPIDEPELVNYIRRRAEEVGRVDVFPIACATKNLEGNEIAEFGLLLKAGAVGFSDDGRCIENAHVLRQALLYLKSFDVPIVQHAEESTLSSEELVGYASSSLISGFIGLSDSVETSVIARDIEIAKETGGWIHFTHVSSARSVELIRRAKKEGVRITCDTTPHHLTFTLEDVIRSDYSTNFKMYPPLRTERDREALWEGLLDGTIDCIATDHAPHEWLSKEQDFVNASRGIIGLQTAFPMLYREALSRNVDIQLIVDKLSLEPARLFLKMDNTGIIREGFKANLMLYDPEEVWILNEQTNTSKSRNTPLWNKEIQGRVVLTIKRGRIIYDARKQA